MPPRQMPKKKQQQQQLRRKRPLRPRTETKCGTLFSSILQLLFKRCDDLVNNAVEKHVDRLLSELLQLDSDDIEPVNTCSSNEEEEDEEEDLEEDPFCLSQAATDLDESERSLPPKKRKKVSFAITSIPSAVSPGNVLKRSKSVVTKLPKTVRLPGNIPPPAMPQDHHQHRQQQQHQGAALIPDSQSMLSMPMLPE